MISDHFRSPGQRRASMSDQCDHLFALAAVSGLHVVEVFGRKPLLVAGVTHPQGWWRGEECKFFSECFECFLSLFAPLVPSLAHLPRRFAG